MSATPAKAKKAAKPKKPAAHPKYIEMIVAAIGAMKEKGGSSRQKIVKYIAANYKVDAANVNQHTKVALRNGSKSGVLKQSKGTGASGSFKIGEKKTAKPKKKAVKAKKPKKAPAKKPAAAKKAAKPKKTPAKKVKKPKSPKKAKAPAAKKAAKPKAKKATKAKKPAAKKSPKKAAKK